MDSAVVSDKLKELLENWTVKAAVFTTYTFEPDFLEQEVIPLLLPGDIPFSSDARVKEFQVREALRVSNLDIEVFYDLQMFRKEGNCSPSMEYLCHGVNRGKNAFHAKLNLILLHDHEKEMDCLLVGAGSNNLTQAGWWDNIECQHWEVIGPEDAQRAFLNRLHEDIAFLQNEQHLEAKTQNSALAQVAKYLESCTGSNQAEPVGYYGLTHIEQHGDFRRFLRRQSRKNWSYRNWTLEIISPFFAENTHNTEHKFFFDLGVQEIHLLLPTDQEGQALCHRDYHQHIIEQDGIHWAEWVQDSARSLGLTGETFRRLHAKIYHFYNKKQSWVFVGSVNFSHKAMKKNIEAGFFVKLPTAAPLLKPITHPEQIERFQNPQEIEPGDADLGKETLPEIHLAYDWLEKTLAGTTESHKGCTINILTPEGVPAIANWKLTGTQHIFEGAKGAKGATDALEALLKNGSLVKLEGHYSRSGDAFPAHIVMLQQTGWSHKPLNLPDLTAEQILAIYADMSPERRQLLLMNAQIRKLVLEGTAGEMTAPAEDFVAEQFFSEYAEIFHAFRHLKKRLREALQRDSEPLVDYYLSGTGMDSLPTLIERTINADSKVKAVTAYLLLLCAQEIYEETDFIGRIHVEQRLCQVRTHLKALKSADRLQLENNTPARRCGFFIWFEAQFSKNYKVHEPVE